jgi:hypothetical protein
MDTEVVGLHFVLAAEYEEVVAISWNPVEGKTIKMKCLGRGVINNYTRVLKFVLNLGL